MGWLGASGLHSPGDYLWAVDAMDAHATSIPDLLPGAAYFFAVTAHDVSDFQSDFSVEHAFIAPNVQP
jgi:hypothetical protein